MVVCNVAEDVVRVMNTTAMHDSLSTSVIDVTLTLIPDAPQDVRI